MHIIAAVGSDMMNNAGGKHAAVTLRLVKICINHMLVISAVGSDMMNNAGGKHAAAAGSLRKKQSDIVKAYTV